MKVGDRIRTKRDGSPGVLVGTLPAEGFGRHYVGPDEPKHYAIVVLDHEGWRRVLPGSAIVPDVDPSDLARAVP